MSPEEEEARERLLFHLENQTGFWFGLVVGDDARPRARVREAAEAWCEEHGRAFVVHDPEPEGLPKLAVELARGDSPGVHWILADGVKGVVEAWNAGATQMLMAMNERREAYRKRLDGGIVVEGRSSLKRILREMAPDLFSIRAFVAEPGEDPTAGRDLPEWEHPVSLVTLMSAEEVDPELALERLSRMMVLEGPATKGSFTAEGLAMVSLFNAGRRDEAMRHTRELLARIEQKPDRCSYLHVYLGALAYRLLALDAASESRNDHEAVRLYNLALDHLASHQLRESRERGGCWMLATQINKDRALALIRIGDKDAAMEAIEVHIRLLSAVPVNNLPAEMQLDLLDSHVRLADIFWKKREPDAAEDTLHKAVSIAAECASRHPEDPRWQFESLRTLGALGRAQLLKNDVAAALTTLVPAAALAERLAPYGSSGAPWREMLEVFHFDLSLALASREDSSEASDRIRLRVLGSMREKFDRTADDVKFGWWLALFHLERARLLEKKDLAGAKDSAQQALELVSRLPVRNDDDADTKGQIEALRAFVRKPGKKRRPKKH